VDESALVEALQNGDIAGAGLDVLEHEPPDPNDPLPKLGNVIVTPHTAGPTYESLAKRAANSFYNIQRVWNGGDPLWTAQFDAPD
jgi:phosphoglycerate dehydrogenase-like enzyme